MNSFMSLYLFILVAITLTLTRTQFYPYNNNYYAQGGNNPLVYPGAANWRPQESAQYQFGNNQPNFNAWSYANQNNGDQISEANSFSNNYGGGNSVANSGAGGRPIRMPQGNNNQMHHGGKKGHSNKRRRFHPRRPHSQRYKDFRAVYHEIERNAEPGNFNATQEEHDSNDDFNGRSIVAPGQYPHMVNMIFLLGVCVKQNYLYILISQTSDTTYK